MPRGQVLNRDFRLPFVASGVLSSLAPNGKVINQDLTLISSPLRWEQNKTDISRPAPFLFPFPWKTCLLLSNRPYFRCLASVKAALYCSIRCGSASTSISLSCRGPRQRSIAYSILPLRACLKTLDVCIASSSSSLVGHL